MASPENIIVPPVTPDIPVPSAGPDEWRAPLSNRFLIRDLDWKAYRAISDALGEHHHYRLSYDGRDLELMTKSLAHGMYGRFLVWMVRILTRALRLPVRCGGDMTCDREDIERAIEPDEAFYIQNAHRIRGKTKVDLTVDPPPDLGVEIDLTTDARRRMSIYAAIRVGEIWRYEDRTRSVFIHILQPDGQYVVVDRSRCLPLVTSNDLTAFLRRLGNDDHEDDNVLLDAFEQWVREQLAKPQ